MARPARKPAHDELHLWWLVDPARPLLVGRLRLTEVGQGVSLTYDPSWLASGRPLSEDLPLRSGELLPRLPRTAAGAVDDARPDRWGERVIQYIDHPLRLSLMEYLYYAGDDRFGALGVSTSPSTYQPCQRGPLPRLPEAQRMSDAVAKINDKQPLTDIEKAMVHAGGSFGGTKPKALIAIEGEQWVIKFFNREPVDLPLVEHATMTLAHRAGIRVARTLPLRLVDAHAVAVRRFDRDGNLRLHTLSAGTALRAATATSLEPELSYPALAELLRRIGDTTNRINEQDARELFRRMVFNILTDNTDDHEKNHALLMPAPNRVRLSPAYDVVPSNSGQGRHEFGIGDDGRLATLANAISQCTRFGMNRQEAADVILEVIAVVDRWQQHFVECGVSGGDIELLADQLDGPELRGQRRDSKLPAVTAAPRRKSRSPFAAP